jgi:hypothetical protein
MTAPDTILRLVDRFDSGRIQYTGPAYNETQLRLEFLNPFFVALGPDRNDQMESAGIFKYCYFLVGQMMIRTNGPSVNASAVNDGDQPVSGSLSTTSCISLGWRCA